MVKEKSVFRQVVAKRDLSANLRQPTPLQARYILVYPLIELLAGGRRQEVVSQVDIDR